VKIWVATRCSASYQFVYKQPGIENLRSDGLLCVLNSRLSICSATSFAFVVDGFFDLLEVDVERNPIPRLIHIPNSLKQSILHRRIQISARRSG